MDEYKVKLTFTERILGTAPKDKAVYESYILSKADELPEELADEELATVPNLEEKGWTGFHTDEEGPFLYDYVVKGFFKDAAKMLRRSPGTLSKKVTAYKQVIDGTIFPFPRRIHLQLNGELGILERPLRAATPQGERVALARSDTAPAGTVIEFTIKVLPGAAKEAWLRELFDYGALRGLGQWRNASYGRFTYTLEKVQ